MVGTLARSLLCWAILISPTAAAAPTAETPPAEAPPAESPAESPAAETDAAAADGPLKPRGRLPAHYGRVVDQQQREAIYRIQEEYRPKITDLQAQLDVLRRERNEKIEAVLRPEQRQQIEAAKAAKKSARAAQNAETPDTSKTVPNKSPKK